MIVAKTPLRIPLAGGLSDLKSFASQFGGVTVSSTINKYVYAVVGDNLEGQFELRYQNIYETAQEARQIKHPLIREALILTGLEQRPLTISIIVDLAGESGLGTSGAITVSLLHALYRLKGEEVSKMRLLTEAAHIEVDILEGASGYHDPSICALGGLKLIEYQGSEVKPRDIAISPESKALFEKSLLFFYSGHHAKSKPSLDLLSSHIRSAEPLLHEIKGLGYGLEQAFLSANLPKIAEIIGEQQRLKQLLPGKFIDDYVRDIVKRVRSTGAYAQLPGGKISAFVIVCCPNGEHAAVREALKDLKEVYFQLETEGTKATEI
ncbi:MAG: hypothetical protein R2880_03760 [Deinococcales bacterium]